VSEVRDVLAAIEEGLARGGRMALATIVSVRGSTYRREGARLLVPEHGKPVGNISGGCLEGDVRATAAEVMRDGRPRLVHFDLTADDEVVWGWGLGCNGVIDLFIEPAEGAAGTAAALRRALEQEEAVAVVTVIEGRDSTGPGTQGGNGSGGGPEPPGTRILVRPDGTVEGSLGRPDLDEVARAEAVAAMREERSGVVTLGGGARAFVEALVPPPRVLVCGAGHDAIPLVRFISVLGWRVEVVDDRDAFLKPRRFTVADRFVKTSPIDAATSAGVDERTHVVVMSHNFLRDKDYLRSFLGSPAPYIGMLGPKARLERLLAALRDEGFEPPPGSLDVVHGPAGLDLGGDGPEEVGWAIAAELLAVRAGRSGGFLRDRSGPIHGSRQAGALTTSG
jgi:xanthine dehydrogenase accessory factor